MAFVARNGSAALLSFSEQVFFNVETIISGFFHDLMVIMRIKACFFFVSSDLKI